MKYIARERSESISKKCPYCVGTGKLKIRPKVLMNRKTGELILMVTSHLTSDERNDIWFEYEDLGGI